MSEENTVDTKPAVHFAGNTLQRICHNASANAGWWKDAKTGVDYLELVRDPTSRFGKALISEKLMLSVSELAEAMEGLRKDRMDDKLPHRKMLEVELADAVIRIFDLAGALRFDLGAAIAQKLEYNAVRPDHKMENRAAEGGKAF